MPRRKARGLSRTALFVIIAVVILLIVFLGPGISLLNGSTSTTSTISSTTNSATNTSSGSLASLQTQSSASLWSIEALEDGDAICHSVNGLPDPGCTPGATDSNVTQADIYSTICVSGWTSTVRPPENYTEQLKFKSIEEYGYSDTYASDYEEDHLIPLELGGSPTSVYNLWAEPHYGTFTSYDKDALENYLNAQVCDGKMTLAQAQQEIASNWVQYWETYGLGNTTTGGE
jgi:hypothetical protein